MYFKTLNLVGKPTLLSMKSAEFHWLIDWMIDKTAAHRFTENDNSNKASAHSKTQISKAAHRENMFKTSKTNVHPDTQDCI